MSIANLTNACPSCGAEESFDVLLARMVEDADARRLIADLVEKSLTLGGRVMRYLRLHKPAKQRMRMSRVHELLAELVADINRGAITRKGRDWAAPVECWKAAIEAVFDAVERGTLTTPLQGNGYLYEVVLRMADRHEAEKERETEADRRNARAPLSAIQAYAKATQAGDDAQARARSAVAELADRLVSSPPKPPAPSSAALRMQAENAAYKARVARTQDTNPATKEERTPD